MSSEDVKTTSYLQDKCSNLSSFLRHACLVYSKPSSNTVVDNARENGCDLLRSKKEKFDCAAFVVVTHENVSSFQKVMAVSFLRLYLCNQPGWFLMFIGPCVILIVEQRQKTLDVTSFIISLFNAQHVSDVSTSILRSLRLIC